MQRLNDNTTHYYKESIAPLPPMKEKYQTEYPYFGNFCTNNAPIATIIP
jgi:hypothetical protein